MLAFAYQIRYSMLAVFLLGIAGAMAVTLFSRHLYRSQIILTKASDSTGGGLSSLLGQFGGLASLAGLNLGAGGGGSGEAVAVLSSRLFSQQFIESENLLPILFFKDWDSDRKRWRSDKAEDIPTMGDAIKKFDEKVRRVNVDQVSGLIVVTIDWNDRELAAQWANKLVAMVNQELRRRAVAEGTRSLAYLHEAAGKTEDAEVRDAIYKAVEAQVKSITLANVREDYAFKVLDPAVPADADKYIWPRPVLVLGVGVICSLLLAMIWLLTRLGMHRLRTDYRDSLTLR